MTVSTEHTDDTELVDLLARTMRAVSDAAPDLPLEQRPDRHRWMMAAAAVALVGVGGAGLVLRSGSEPTRLPPLDPNSADPTVVSFGPSHAEQRIIYDAQERMLRDCMGGAGQVWSLTDFDRYGGDPDPLWELIGRTDMARAQTIGYNPWPQAPVADQMTDIDTNAPAWENAFGGGIGDEAPTVRVVDPITGGDPVGGPMTQASGGCWGAAQALLYGDQARYTSLSLYIANELSQQQPGGPLDDPRMNGPFREWSDCMVDRGHDRYVQPMDPDREAALRQPDPDQFWQPTAQEIETAVDDVMCKQTAGLIDITQQLVDAYGRDAAAGAIPLLEEYGEMVDRAIRQASAYLAGTLSGPWRASLPDTAPRNSSTCVWLPDDPATLDMSAGEQNELNAYLGALAEVEIPSDAASSVAVPPWLLGDGSCIDDATPGLLQSVEEVAG